MPRQSASGSALTIRRPYGFSETLDPEKSGNPNNNSGVTSSGFFGLLVGYNLAVADVLVTALVQAPNDRRESSTIVITASPPQITETQSAKRNSSGPIDLVDALLDLHDVRKVAREEGDIEPDIETVARADRVLRAMFRVSPRPYYVYAMPSGDIAIDAHSPQGSRVVVICDLDGSARCLHYFNEAIERRDYDDTRALPDRFVVEALNQATFEAPDYSL